MLVREVAAQQTGRVILANQIWDPISTCDLLCSAPLSVWDVLTWVHEWLTVGSSCVPLLLLVDFYLPIFACSFAIFLPSQCFDPEVVNQTFILLRFTFIMHNVFSFSTFVIILSLSDLIVLKTLRVYLEMAMVLPKLAHRRMSQFIRETQWLNVFSVFFC